MKVVDLLIKAIRGAAAYNPEAMVAPCCILWTDPERQWEAAIPRLRAQMPELLILGDYNFEKKSGPAIWLRCVIAGKIPGLEPLPATVPVLYLPGVGRQDLRMIEDMTEGLKPLAELQYRGVYWSQANSKDWTLLAFLVSGQGGLGLDLARDQKTREAMLLALVPFLDKDIGLLAGKQLDQDYFNTLLTGGDPVRELLQWLDLGDDFKAAKGKNEWQAFISVCTSQFGFNPEKEGLLRGAEKLAMHEGPWQQVWARFCESPLLYPNIPAQIRKCPVPEDNILWRTGHGYKGWPQWNEGQEEILRSKLNALGEKPPHEARQLLKELEGDHGSRRELIWEELGQAPLACALEHLALLAEITGHALAGGTVEDLSAGYQNQGWQADDAVIRALTFTNKPAEQEAVFTAIKTIYPPWADQSARYLQRLARQGSYPAGSAGNLDAVPAEADVCYLFVDGLRFDTARRLAFKLQQYGCLVEEKAVWAALPTVTATGKPAVSPVRQKIAGGETDRDFEPSVAESGQSLKGGYHFRKLLNDEDWAVLGETDTGSGEGKAWTEYGSIDHFGHNLGWKLARQLDSLVEEVAERVAALLEAGWTTVRVVTDHGWLILPGGLPKIELPASLVENKWGRCAVLKPGAITEEKFYPWFWNPGVHFALAPGINCYRKGLEYTHGGLSLQECLSLELKVTRGVEGSADSLEIAGLAWRGMRCLVTAKGNYAGFSVDIRIHPGDPSTSVVMNVKSLRDDGTASVVVDRGELEGTRATVLLLEPGGAPAAQLETVIGGGDA